MSVRLSFFTNVCTSVRLSACISDACTGRSYVKFDIGDFNENLLKNSKFGCNWAKISAPSHGDLSASHCFRRQQIAIEALSSSEMVSGCQVAEEVKRLSELATVLCNTPIASPFTNHCYIYRPHNTTVGMCVYSLWNV
jgi:hypothetical protein